MILGSTSLNNGNPTSSISSEDSNIDREELLLLQQGTLKIEGSVESSVTFPAPVKKEEITAIANSTLSIEEGDQEEFFSGSLSEGSSSLSGRVGTSDSLASPERRVATDILSSMSPVITEENDGEGFSSKSSSEDDEFFTGSSTSSSEEESIEDELTSATSTSPLSAPTLTEWEAELKTGFSTKTKSSQEVLRDFLQELKNKGYNPELTATLSKNSNGFETSSFDLPAEPGKTGTFFIPEYIITWSKPDGTQETLSFRCEDRKVYTTAESVEKGLPAAVEYLHQICQMAKGEDATLAAKAMSTRAFRFSYTSNSTGMIKSFQSLQIMNDKGETTYTHAIDDSNRKKFIYDFKTGKVKELNPSDRFILGSVEHATKEEAELQYLGYTIDTSKYLTLTEEEKRLEYIQEINEKIKKKEEEFAKIKANFIQSSFFNWLRGKKGKISPQRKQVIANVQALATEKRGVSEVVDNYLDLQEEIKKTEKAQQSIKELLDRLNEMASKAALNTKEEESLRSTASKIDPEGAETKSVEDLLKICQETWTEELKKFETEIRNQKQELKSLKELIDHNQRTFNDELSQLHTLNQELKNLVKHLGSLKTVIPGQSLSQKETDNLLEKISDKKLAALNSRIGKNEGVITAIVNRLEKVQPNVKNTAAAHTVDVFDGMSEEESSD